MKKILITGADSYIGTSFEHYMSSSVGYEIDTLDMRDSLWSDRDFTRYDVVIHVAGIVHAKKQKETPEVQKFYYEVNTKLAEDVAIKAKSEGVKQFIFMSTMSVYGESAGIGQNRIIRRETTTSPNNAYGVSKLQAEGKIIPLQSDTFSVAVLRPPMIYGKNCKGNYITLAKLAKKLPVFPQVNNSRSMLYIDNLCEFLKILIDNKASGLFMPQDEMLVNTSDMVASIAKANGKKIIFTKVFNPFLKLGASKISMINKAFGSLSYDKELSGYWGEYQKASWEDAIIAIENETTGI